MALDALVSVTVKLPLVLTCQVPMGLLLPSRMLPVCWVWIVWPVASVTLPEKASSFDDGLLPLVSAASLTVAAVLVGTLMAMPSMSRAALLSALLIDRKSVPKKLVSGV